MRVKQYKGTVYGADLTAKERRAMNIEINRQIVEADRKYLNNVDAMILYFLHKHLASGKSGSGARGNSLRSSTMIWSTTMKCQTTTRGLRIASCKKSALTSRHGTLGRMLHNERPENLCKNY